METFWKHWVSIMHTVWSCIPSDLEEMDSLSPWAGQLCRLILSPSPLNHRLPDSSLLPGSDTGHKPEVLTLLHTHYWKLDRKLIRKQQERKKEMKRQQTHRQSKKNWKKTVVKINQFLKYIAFNPHTMT